MTKQWVRVSRSAKGERVVTVTTQDENIVGKFSTKAFASVKEGVQEAKTGSERFVAEIKEALR